jgi:hypothetical protein
LLYTLSLLLIQRLLLPFPLLFLLLVLLLLLLLLLLLGLRILLLLLLPLLNALTRSFRPFFLSHSPAQSSPPPRAVFHPAIFSLAMDRKLFFLNIKGDDVWTGALIQLSIIIAHQKISGKIDETLKNQRRLLRWGEFFV